MPTKTAEDHLNNSRLGAYAESLVKTFLLEYCDFAYETQNQHPADLIAELGAAMFTVQVKARRQTKQGKYKKYSVDILAFVFMPEKRVMFMPGTSKQSYFTFNESVLTPDLEIQSFQQTLNEISQIPVLNNL